MTNWGFNYDILRDISQIMTRKSYRKGQEQKNEK